MFRIVGIEPRCFDHVPSADEIATAMRHQVRMDGFSRLYSRVTYDAAVAHGVDEPWVGALRQRLRRDRYSNLFDDLATPITRRRDRWKGARRR
jgi:hypothetical protein